jgi:hypothetical protein
MLKVLDFTKCEFGMLVKFSPHHKKQCGDHHNPKIIGLIVGKQFYEDRTLKTAVCYPIVHWEGEVMGHVCHPIHLIPYRKQNKLPKITISD